MDRRVIVSPWRPQDVSPPEEDQILEAVHDGETLESHRSALGGAELFLHEFHCPVREEQRWAVEVLNGSVEVTDFSSYSFASHWMGAEVQRLSLA